MRHMLDFCIPELRHAFLSVWATCLLFAVGQPAILAAQSHVPDSTLGRLVPLFEGSFDNAHLISECDRSVEKCHRVKTYIVRLPDRTFGTPAFYLEEYTGDGKGELFRVRVYTFTPSPKEDSVNLLLALPRDAEYWKGAHASKRKLEQLTSSDFVLEREECSLTLRKLDDQVVGHMHIRSCDVDDSWIDYSLYISDFGHTTCFTRRALATNQIVWTQAPGYPCIRQQRISPEPTAPEKR